MKSNKVAQATCVFLSVFLLMSCSSYKNVSYLQESKNNNDMDIKTLYDKSVVRFQPEDILSITVNASREPAIAAAFNLPLQPSAANDVSNDNIPVGNGRQTYLINKKGEIDFPILGTIKVQGMSVEDLENYLKKALREYIKEDPVITIRLTNYSISVIGEVTHPGRYNVQRDKINIFEALALAGDMTIYGKRDNVMLLREGQQGDSKIIRLNLNSIETVTSPYYYLQQNDILYIEPNKAKAKTADISTQTTIWISAGSLLLGVINLVILVGK